MISLCEELPYASIILQEHVEDYCANCFNEISDTRIQCDDCLEVTYCSLKCQRTDWKNVHCLECQILRSQNQPLTPTMRLSIRVLLKTFGFENIENEPKSFNGATFDELETNFDEYRSSKQHNRFLNDLMAIFQISATSQLSAIFQKVEKRHMIAVICAVLANTFSIYDDLKCENIGVGIYIGLSKHNHACSSKNHVVFVKNRAILRAPEGTKYNQELTISYCSRMLPTSERRKSISQVHFFKCQCDLCCSSTENEFHSQELFKKIENTNELRNLQKLREEYSEELDVDNLLMCHLIEKIAQCAIKLPLKERFRNEAILGIQVYINRLGLGTPEVTRRLYLACLILEKYENGGEIFEKTLESCDLSHGKNHPLTVKISGMIKI
ncbi:unnamed protein product [Caenorhabditis angaria]|uniref:MYND-type domain-containing protein n=1 Tax=Caenorhabditis angaria TaxID=860376 RepID=A0A9P1I5P2_9PELO|nr:unnamed protein product [Caenorhabditis angaria]